MCVRVLCWIGCHCWKEPEDWASYTSNAGYDVGHVITGYQRCKHCSSGRYVYRFGSSVDLVNRDAKWSPRHPEIDRAIAENYELKSLQYENSVVGIVVSDPYALLPKTKAIWL